MLKRAAVTIGIVLVALGMAAARRATPVAAPDGILYNGKIFTSDAQRPTAQALAITGERISAVGDDATTRALAGPHTGVYDLGGRTVIPGINDAHIHLDIDPPGAVHVELAGHDPTWAQVRDALAAAAAKNPKGSFLEAEIGPTVFHDVAVDRKALDAVAPDNPVVLTTLTGHASILNSAAIAKVGLREDEPDPMGGRYERDASGKLTGVIREYAGLALSRRLAALASDNEAAAQLRLNFAEAVKFGITSMQDMSDALTPERDIKLFAMAPTPIRIRIMRMPGTTAAGRDIAEGLNAPRHPSALVTVSGTKWMLDGVPIENGLTPREVPSSPPGESLDYGATRLPLTFSEKEIAAMLQESLASGSQMMFHVSGNPAAKALLDAMQASGGAAVWNGKRVRFEHGDGLYPDLIPRAKEMGIVVVQNPSHFIVASIFGPHAKAYKDVQPFRTLLAAGIPLAIGSDGPTNPYLNILFATTDPSRPTEALTREQAVTAYTLTSAYAEFAENDKGSLAPGKLADLAVLSQDIFHVATPDLPKTESVLTMVGGKIVYDAGAIAH